MRRDAVDAGLVEAERVSRHRHDAERGDRATRNAGFWVSKDNAPQGPSNEAENVYLDSHIYACFVDDLKAMTPQQHIRQVCKFERDHINQCCWDGLPPVSYTHLTLPTILLV